MYEKPTLIIGSADSLHPLHYLCSHCMKPFYLSGDEPPKKAVAELLQTFGEHVKREHPSANPGSTTPSERSRYPGSD
jgi:hypothetical protein